MLCIPFIINRILMLWYVTIILRIFSSGAPSVLRWSISLWIQRNSSHVSVHFLNRCFRPSIIWSWPIFVFLFAYHLTRRISIIFLVSGVLTLVLVLIVRSQPTFSFLFFFIYKVIVIISLMSIIIPLSLVITEFRLSISLINIDLDWVL